MRGLGSTIRALQRLPRQWRALTGPSIRPAPPPSKSGARLVEIAEFGSNPGELRMLAYAPPKLKKKPALVVVLHGCMQTSAEYDRGSGWSALARRQGFLLLYPEQSRRNNPKNCFNWFLPGDIGRDKGEVLSIRQMVAQLSLTHDVDPGRIFITGLSAGGAMATAMLATYPDVFAGGAIIAGLPYRAAETVTQAFGAMVHGHERDIAARGDAVRAASPHNGPWPRISIWHGTADRAVRPVNAAELVKQWTDIHGLGGAMPRTEVVGRLRRRDWCDENGVPCVRELLIDGLGHGVAVDTSGKTVTHEKAGGYFLDMEISSTTQIARDWGLLPDQV